MVTTKAVKKHIVDAAECQKQRCTEEQNKQPFHAGAVQTRVFFLNVKSSVQTQAYLHGRLLEMSAVAWTSGR